jgi:hypothetical protein
MAKDKENILTLLQKSFLKQSNKFLETRKTKPDDPSIKEYYKDYAITVSNVYTGSKAYFDFGDGTRFNYKPLIDPKTHTSFVNDNRKIKDLFSSLDKTNHRSIPMMYEAFEKIGPGVEYTSNDAIAESGELFVDYDRSQQDYQQAASSLGSKKILTIEQPSQSYSYKKPKQTNSSTPLPQNSTSSPSIIIPESNSNNVNFFTDPNNSLRRPGGRDPNLVDVEKGEYMFDPSE